LLVAEQCNLAEQLDLDASDLLCESSDLGLDVGDDGRRSRARAAAGVAGVAELCLQALCICEPQDTYLVHQR
jgi:hypothetical protein